MREQKESFFSREKLADIRIKSLELAHEINTVSNVSLETIMASAEYIYDFILQIPAE
ncbi:MAG: hypothetical protein JWP12_311 [Bacteroidetes bacterium]|nr:hypothetical protein [Bacteroidota bacterium]